MLAVGRFNELMVNLEKLWRFYYIIIRSVTQWFRERPSVSLVQPDHILLFYVLDLCGNISDILLIIISEHVMDSFGWSVHVAEKDKPVVGGPAMVNGTTLFFFYDAQTSTYMIEWLRQLVEHSCHDQNCLNFLVYANSNNL